MATGYQIVRRGKGFVAQFELDADDCEQVASWIPATDGFADDLRAAAADLRRAGGDGG